MSSIYREPAVVRRIGQRSSLKKITSNSTIAAAVMVLAALIALVVANSPAHEVVREVLEVEMSFSLGIIHVHMALETFVNDFLMAIFFLLVGIELKYEVSVGQLRKPRQAMLPMLAAVGGVAVPALIYLALNASTAPHGWATPIATDIAFALGVMSLLGNRISPQTKVFFQTLAIADDILAIVVIALFYGKTPNIAWSAASLGVLVILWGMNRLKIYASGPYLLVGLVLWVCMYHSGIHATLAGVLLAFFLPSHSDVRLSKLGSWLSRQARELEDYYDDEHHVLGQHDFTHGANTIEQVMHHVTPPLQRVEHYISVFVNFVVLPIFAFVNAQITLVGADFGVLLSSTVARGVFCGAVFGKPLGIVFVTLLLVKGKICKLPAKVDWIQITAVGLMGGLGFTMSILISNLAFPDAGEILAAKVAVLTASFASAILGLLFVHMSEFYRHRKNSMRKDIEKK